MSWISGRSRVSRLRSARRAGVGLVGVLAASGCGLAEARPVETEPPAPVAATRSLEPIAIDPPAPPGSTLPALAAEDPTTVIKEHQLLITWLAPSESGGRLSFARLSQQTWSQPVTIADGVSRLDPPDRASLTVIDTQAVRRTLIARTGDVVARSGNAGRTWSRLPAPALPFASFAGGDEGGYAFWLDVGDGSARLLGSRILAGEALLDPLVAAGTSTAAAMTWDGPLVVYRDRTAEDRQQIALVRRHDARWSSPQPVHVEEWPRHPHLPASGPRVAALRRDVAVAWYTEASHRPRVLVAFSRDAGRTFGRPVEVDAKRPDQTPSGPVDVALDEQGRALVLWLAATGPREASLNLALVAPEGGRGESIILARGDRDRLAGMPQLARAGDRVAAAWVEGVPGRIRAVAVPLAGIRAPSSPRPAVAASAQRPAKRYTGRGRTGDPVPDFELVSLDGDKVSLASLRGRAVLLNLWATWCLPCIAEMPELGELRERYAPRGLTVVGLSIDAGNAIDKVRAFVSERKVPLTVWLDPEMRVYHALRVRGLPTTFVIDREGRIVLRRDEPIAADDVALGEALERALGSS